MLWACLHFSDLPLRAVFDDGEHSLPCAVVDGPRQRQQIAFVNAAAKRNGIGEGRVLAAARALCPGLQARPRDRSSEQRLLLSLAAWGYRFSSHVSVSEPDALLLEVGASLRLFGGWQTLERRLRRGLAAIGHAPSLAVAPAPAAARVLARQHDGFCTDQPAPMLAALGNVPLGRSGLPEKTIALLYNVGARTLRDVFTLPRPELGRRIGAAQLAALDRLRGIDQELLPLYRPPDCFENRIELDDRVEAWPPLLFPLRRLCAELSVFLAARDGGVQRCDLALDHEDQPPTHVAIELLTPQRDARVLYELIRSRLERTILPAPVCDIALIAKDLPEFRPRHQDLFDPKRAQGLEWPELAERLRAHLGDNAVRRLAIAGDHRPEKAWQFADSSLPAASRLSSPISAPFARSRLPPAAPQHGRSPLRISEEPSHSPLPLAEEAAPQARVRVAPEAAISETPPRFKSARAAMSETSPSCGKAVLTPAFSRQRERENGEAGKTKPSLDCEKSCIDPDPSSQHGPSPLRKTEEPSHSPLPLAEEAAPQARVRVAPEAAISETPPRFKSAQAAMSETSPSCGKAALTPALCCQRERENGEALSRQPKSGKSIPGRAEAIVPAAVREAAPCEYGTPDRLEKKEPAAAACIRPRPLWLLPRAIPLRGAAPDILAGPERIESGWWDGGDTRRDYYVVQTREGQRAWAFLAPGTSDGWMLHGWFA